MDLESLIGGSAQLKFPSPFSMGKIQEFLPHTHLLDILAEGPGSCVFNAQYSNGYDCIIKVYSLPYDDAGAGYLEMQRAKFERESSQRLPNLVPRCLDVGRRDGLIFSIWNYAKGYPLNWIKSQFSNSPALKATLIEACKNSLAKVHAAGLLHLDLKPNHIFVQTEPKISIQFIDWGLACDRAKGPRADHLLFATPAYTRPERLAGAEPCPEDDWYALQKSLEACIGSIANPPDFAAQR